MLIVFICLLLICGAAASAVLWSRVRRVPARPQGFIVIPCTEHTQGLEQTVRSAYWSEMLESYAMRRGILIVLINAGSNEFEARKLAAELGTVEAVDISALADRIIRSTVI